MPSKPRDRDRERDREKDRERNPDTPRSKEKSRHKSSRSSRGPDKGSGPRERRSTDASPTTTRRSSMPVPEVERRTSSVSPRGSKSSLHLGSKTSLPYPSFSKAHSKEAVGSREDVVNPRLSYYTPDPTDLERGKEQDLAGEIQNTAGVAPPSPPETTMDQRSRIEAIKAETVKVERKKLDLQKAAEDLKRSLRRSSSGTSEGGLGQKSRSSKSRASLRESTKEGEKSTASAKRSKPSTPSKLRPKPATVEDTASATSLGKRSSFTKSTTTKSDTTNGSGIDSNATSIAPDQPHVQSVPTPSSKSDSSPATVSDSSPTTPTLTEPQLPPARKETPANSIFSGLASAYGDSPMPPPPPPPPEIPMPRVDYLIQNGGLPQSISRSLLVVGQTGPTCPSTSAITDQVNDFFGPFNHRLDDYNKVMSRNGSLAVATGYRSVARRLLDRLEAVFARDISSESCGCTLCQSSPTHDGELDDKRGVSWGEILEYVCGRQELPQWPPFVMDATHVGLGISGSEHVNPMQKLDVDVPDEFRDHYIRQSKKTKQDVDKWLDKQPQQPSSPPPEVDDETLTFAMLTRLDPEQRHVFSTLLGIVPSRPPSTAGTEPGNTCSTSLLTSGLAIQRLYRLQRPPRDPETAMYLSANPSIHNVLATLAAVSDGEWEILTSGRFDGFLWSGADDIPSSPYRPSSRGPSRGPTPASRMATPSMPPSRGPTPASTSVGAPVALDEETEIAVLAEVEREIFNGMEALENAFEALHYKAETVRRALRERGAGLAQANQKRRGSLSLDARLGTPASHLGGAWESETDDGIDDGMSELAPDDSASNVSSSRHRRPKRRNERRTPALVEEEDEDEDELSQIRSKTSKRR